MNSKYKERRHEYKKMMDGIKKTRGVEVNPCMLEFPWILISAGDLYVFSAGLFSSFLL